MIRFRTVPLFIVGVFQCIEVLQFRHDISATRKVARLTAMSIMNFAIQHVNVNILDMPWNQMITGRLSGVVSHDAYSNS